MNELINFIILGMIQGLTEFFPVSSSGHLVLFQDILSINNEGASAEIIAHFGTLFSILLFYKASFFSSKSESDFFHINTLKFLVFSTILCLEMHTCKQIWAKLSILRVKLV